MPRPKKTDLDRTAGAVFPQSLMDEVDRSQPLASQVYSFLRAAIVEMVIPPGSPLVEREIGNILEISRTPVREATLKLADEGLVQIIPNSGTFVSRIELETVFEGQLVRRALERETARIAAMSTTEDGLRRLQINLYEQELLASQADHQSFYRCDEQFHRLISAMAAGEGVWRQIHSAKGQLDRVRRLAFPLPNHLNVVLAEHREIYEAIRGQKPEDAENAMKRHLARVFDTVGTLVQEQSHLFSGEAARTISRYAMLIG